MGKKERKVTRALDQAIKPLMWRRIAEAVNPITSQNAGWAGLMRSPVNVSTH